MKIIVGLGNPESKYENTRHNAGFDFVDRLSGHLNSNINKNNNPFSCDKKLEAVIAKGKIDGEDILLVKPQTFMNLSGAAVSKTLSYYKAAIDNLVVVADDIDLPLGQARIRLDGGSAGQKGVQNIIEMLGTDQFVRVRIGVGRPLVNGQVMEERLAGYDAVDYVLGKFPENERKLADKIIEEVVHYLVPFLGQKTDKIQAHTIEI